MLKTIKKVLNATKPKMVSTEVVYTLINGRAVRLGKPNDLIHFAYCTGWGACEMRLQERTFTVLGIGLFTQLVG